MFFYMGKFKSSFVVKIDCVFLFSASQTPFQFNFLTDAWTMATKPSVVRGFKLTYFQTTC